ncbi:hypothetical protein LDENG_00201890 [Lucifuga dentata]|nr:hypothetical protein LDENG_00201890 [Lucifuga dentata]
MSQAGKVLHLYVEVRSVPEEEGESGGHYGTSHLELQCPDVLPRSQRTSGRSSPNPSPNLSLAPPHAEVTNHSLLPSKSSSRHSVTFQLHSPNDTEPPSFTQRRQHDLPLTVPCTPPSTHKPYEVPGEGKTSVVTFGYIEKSSVQNVSTHPSPECQSDPETPFSRSEGSPLPVHLQKRSSDPMWYHGYRVPSPDLSLSRSHCGSPYLQRATRDAVAREATCRALEEFGSPELRRRFAGGSEGHSPTLPRQCRSWAGSPVLPRSSRTLPSRAQLLQLDREVCHGLVNGIPRSPALDQLSAHAGYTSCSNSTLHLCCQYGTGDESHKLSSKFRPPLPAGRPTDIQHEIPTSRIQPRTGYQTNAGAQLTADCSCHGNSSVTSQIMSGTIRYNANANSSLSAKTHCKASPCSSRASDAVSPPSCRRRNFSAASNADAAEKLASKAAALSTASPDRPRLNRNAASHSPILDRKQCSSSPSKDMSVLHRYQIPQYNGDREPSGLEWKLYDHVFYRPPRLSRRLLSCSNKEEFPDEKVQDQSGTAGTSSQSSSGVTGSVADRNDSLSPETSSQSSSHADSSCGMQSDGGSVTAVPSSRSQKLTKAKWDFLFGEPNKEKSCSKDAPPTTPPNSSSLSPTSPSSPHLRPANHRQGRDGEGQKFSHHAVRQVEVELVTANPRGSAPKTGIIRRTIKYSETDLDAVPLRCYRETDLDEVTWSHLIRTDAV